MNLFELSASITLNTSEYEGQIQKARRAWNVMVDALRSGSAATGKAEDAVDHLGDEVADTGDEAKKAAPPVDNLKDKIKGLGNESSSSATKVSRFSEGFGKKFAAAAKIGLTALAAVSTAVGALGVQSLKAYADYEQLSGGVETLFKGSAKVVEAYANAAYATAGMSANDYMETVTSFSASLLQSLGGDTAKAADIADMAIRDMSDNANKMGSSIDSLRSAYTGFSRGTFVMLDNLKLGYAGSQGEMERLLADAEKISGIHYDISNYSDMVSAIHVIQESMGITGTTAKEASETISGSINSAKAAWTNLLTAVAGEGFDIGAKVDTFAQTVITAAGNILPRFAQILGGLATAIGSIAPMLAEEIPRMVAEVLPALVSGVTALLGTVVTALPQLAQTIVDVLPEFANSILGVLPQVLTAAMQIITTLALGIAEAAPTLIPAAVDAIITLCNALLAPEGLAAILDAALALIQGLADGILIALPTLMQAAPEIIGQLVSTLIQFIPELLPVAYDIIWALINGFASAYPDMAENVLSMMGDIGGVIASIDWIGMGLKIIDTIATGVLNSAASFLLSVEDTINPAKDWIDGLIEDAPTWGRDLIDGLIEGIRSMIRKVRNAASDVADAISDFLHFSRPEEGPLREYERWMPDMIDGLARGIEANKDKLRNAAAGLAADIGTSVSPGGASAGRQDGSTMVNINVYGAEGQSINELADVIMERMQSAVSRKGAVFA